MFKIYVWNEIALISCTQHDSLMCPTRCLHIGMCRTQTHTSAHAHSHTHVLNLLCPAQSLYGDFGTLTALNVIKKLEKSTPELRTLQKVAFVLCPSNSRQDRVLEVGTNILGRMVCYIDFVGRLRSPILTRKPLFALWKCQDKSGTGSNKVSWGISEHYMAGSSEVHGSPF